MASATKQIPIEERPPWKQQEGCGDFRMALSRQFRVLSDSYRLHFASSFKTNSRMNTLLNNDCKVAMLLADLRNVVPVGVE